MINETPSTQYHPNAVRGLQQIKVKLQQLLTDVDAAIVSDPPPYVAVSATTATVQNGTVKVDTGDVYETPHENAKTIGKVGLGGVLPLTLDPSTDGDNTWYKITGGQYEGKFIRGASLRMQGA